MPSPAIEATQAGRLPGRSDLWIGVFTLRGFAVASSQGERGELAAREDDGAAYKTTRAHTNTKKQTHTPNTHTHTHTKYHAWSHEHTHIHTRTRARARTHEQTYTHTHTIPRLEA